MGKNNYSTNVKSNKRVVNYILFIVNTGFRENYQNRQRIYNFVNGKN